MFVLNGQPLQIGVAFVDQNEIQRPSNWLEFALPEELAEAGVQEVPDPPDSRFYNGYDEQGLPSPKDHSQLCAFWIVQTRQAANNLLAPTDWIVIREADNGTPVPQKWRDWRESIRQETSTKIAALKATMNTDQLAAYVTSADYSRWEPEAPAEEEVPSE